MSSEEVLFEDLAPFEHIEGTGFTPGTYRKGKSWMTVSHIHEEDIISINHVNSVNKGDMKTMIDAAVNKFGTNKIHFHNVLNPKLIERLQGFEYKVMMDPVMKARVLCLEGEWKK